MQKLCLSFLLICITAASVECSNNRISRAIFKNRNRINTDENGNDGNNGNGNNGLGSVNGNQAGSTPGQVIGSSVNGNSGGTTVTTTVSPVSSQSETPGVPESVASESTTAAPAGISSTTTVSGPATQGAPPGPIPLKCSDYSCSPVTQSNGGGGGGGDENPLTVRSEVVNQSASSNGCRRQLSSRPLKCNMKGGGDCFGVYCLKAQQGNDYCICPLYRVDRQCAVAKPGSCESATGQLPAKAVKQQGKRFRSKTDPDNGDVYGRHFCTSMDDCIKSCQWPKGSCTAVNYGTIAGQQVCELLSFPWNNGTRSWLTNAPGWQFAQVVVKKE